ncbi:TPA: hypothetical protein DCR49_06720 [Candidatus Delongbacteria bacterium]|nr:hypothetical protein [Candidatus Delongbacteria bacterium]
MIKKNKSTRLASLINQLYEKGYFTFKGLNNFTLETEKVELSLSSMKRAVKDLREYFGLDLIYIRKEDKYYLDDEPDQRAREENFLDKFERIKRSPSKNQELMIFYSFVKSMIFSEYYFPPRDNKDEKGMVRDYDDILRIIENVLKDELSEKDVKLAGKIEYHLTEHYKKTQRTKFNNMLNEILDSMRHEYMVRFKYHGIEVQTEPVKLIHYNGIWYLMAYVYMSPRSENLKKVRTYNLALMESNIFKTKEKFSDEDYSVPEFKDSFGIISSRNIKNARIRFYGELADRMKEMLWVDTQITSSGEDRLKGKYCEYVLPYPANTNFELIGKVLSFRGNAEIIEPMELRKEWIETLKKMYNSVK